MRWWRLFALAVATLGLGLVGCDSTASPGATASSTAVSVSSLPSGGSAGSTPSSGAPGRAAAEALTIGELPSSVTASLGVVSQVSDNELGGAATTDRRVFANADTSVSVELDLAIDPPASEATSDYPAYRQSASAYVAVHTGQSKPAIGSQADEFIGTRANGQHVVAITFVQGVTVVMVLMDTTAAIIYPVLCEAIARAQAQKLGGP